MMPQALMRLAMVLALSVAALPGVAQEATGKLLDPAALAECEAAGGHVGRGLGPDELCIRPTADAGMACTSNAECESFCLAETATCGEWKPLFGCHAVLTGEGPGVTICVD